jgi:hypothetical protein
LDYVNNNATDTNYMVFSCFNIATKLVTDRLKNVIDENKLNSDLRFFVSINRKKEWYQHSVHNPVGYHFTCAIMKKKL